MGGCKKHLKRINAPKSWMLDKLGGIWAPKSSPGPHKLRESIPLCVVLSKKLKYSTTDHESKIIVKGGFIKIDRKVRSDKTFPLGMMDVVSIDSVGKHFRVLYDAKGRFILLPIDQKSSKFKLCRVKRVSKSRSTALSRRILGAHKSKNIPYLVTNDSRTIRYPNPEIKKNDTIKLNLETNQIEMFVKFNVGNKALITGGNNVGRIGVISKIERHLDSSDIIQLVDRKGETFATRLDNVFVIGEGTKSLISLPKRHGVRLSNIEERELREKRKATE
ncbi:40S ribosomal protein S4 [Bonamia ostreae]|uniref:40S ribosomal protein S4 n=1 Tax=Bonamia ostreae TaxID=126728 RepID=A0ABV2AHY6_9EUKA